MRANVEQVNTFFAMMGVSDDYIKVMQDSNIFEDYLERYKSVQKNQKQDSVGRIFARPVRL